VNILRTEFNDLAPVNYSDLLRKLREAIGSVVVFKVTKDGHRIMIDADAVARKLVGLNPQSPFGPSAAGTSCASVNLVGESAQRFDSEVLAVRKALADKLNRALTDGGQERTIRDVVTGMLVPLESMRLKSNEKPGLGLEYSFKPHNDLKKQRLGMERKPGQAEALLRFHRLKISVEGAQAFDDQVRDALTLHARHIAENDDDLEELEGLLERMTRDANSDLAKLQKLVDRESIGKIKREAQIAYLEFLSSHYNKGKGADYLRDLARRLRLVEAFLDDPERNDGDYQVSYADVPVNLRDLLARSEAFDILPIIPVIEGNLGESTQLERGLNEYVLGLKMKLNGRVQAHGGGGKTSFEYHAALLNLEGDEHKGMLQDMSGRGYKQKLRLLKTLFLYYVVFAKFGDLEYNPLPDFEQYFLQVFRGDDNQTKRARLTKLYEFLSKPELTKKLAELKTTLKNGLSQKTQLGRDETIVHLAVRQGILETDAETILRQSSFFRQVFGERDAQAMRYISVLPPKVDRRSLVKLRVNLSISDLHFYPFPATQSFSMAYSLEGIQTLPVIIAPDSTKKVYEEYFKKHRLILLRYEEAEVRKLLGGSPIGAFNYRFAFALVAYLGLKLLLDEAPPRTLVPMVRLHTAGIEEEFPEGGYLRSLSKVLAHLLGEEHRTCSQGFVISDIQSALEKGLAIPKSTSYRISNGLSSLYAGLPKRFSFQEKPYDQTERVALIVVTSRLCDGKWGNDQKKVNLVGEVVGIVPTSDGSVEIERYQTFCANYDSQQVYRRPDAVIDAVNRLYEAGFRHFMYIAKSPYTSTLHITKSQEDEELFFMSKSIIEELKGARPDARIYPIFCDRYSVVKVGNESKGRPESLYIQDVLELQNLVRDPAQRTVVFFNLFNGYAMSSDAYYNGVVSYATLLNVYADILDDQDLRQGLIYDGEAGCLKDRLLDSLAFFHFSRYEAERNIAFKLNPYEGIIGEDSVAKLAILPHTQPGVEFNLLAFLTEVRRTINSKENGRAV
jgi:hypothetical protein